MSYLGRKMNEDLQLKGLSERTQSAYLREVRKLKHYFKKSPEQINKKELTDYFIY